MQTEGIIYIYIYTDYIYIYVCMTLYVLYFLHFIHNTRLNDNVIALTGINEV